MSDDNCLRKSIIFSTIILFLIVSYFGLNYSGFCFAKMRYLSNEERIRLAFNSLNSANRLRVKIPGQGYEDREFIKYESFDEYIAENPDCCAVSPPRGSPELPPPSELGRMFGYHSGEYVRIYYKVRYLDDNGRQTSQVIKVDQPQRNCGDPVLYH